MTVPPGSRHDRATSVLPGGDSQWSHVMIAGHLAGRGLAISAATVGRVLAEAKVRPHKVRGWLNRADDPAFWIRAGQGAYSRQADLLPPAKPRDNNAR